MCLLLMSALSLKLESFEVWVHDYSFHVIKASFSQLIAQLQFPSHSCHYEVEE